MRPSGDGAACGKCDETAKVVIDFGPFSLPAVLGAISRYAVLRYREGQRPWKTQRSRAW